MVMISNVSAYGTGYSKVRQNGGSTGKAYDRKRNYRAYLTEKYECLRSTGYSVNINSSLLTEAAGDEKTAKWLEYNLSLIPKAVEGIKSTVEARGAKLVSCSIKINGYDSMTAEVCTVDEADPGTEKARKELEERLQKVREEKKAKQRKAEQKKREEKTNKEAVMERVHHTVIPNASLLSDTRAEILQKVRQDKGRYGYEDIVNACGVSYVKLYEEIEEHHRSGEQFFKPDGTRLTREDEIALLDQAFDHEVAWQKSCAKIAAQRAAFQGKPSAVPEKELKDFEKSFYRTRDALLEHSKNQLNNRHLENIDRISELTEKQEKSVDRFRQL